MVHICAGDRCSTGRNAAIKESDIGQSWIWGGYGEQMLFVIFVFPSLAWAFCRRARTCGGENGPVSRLIER